MGDAPPALGLVVPVFDEADRIEDTLPALLDYAAPSAARPSGVELIIVDDGSTDASAALVTEALDRWTTGSDSLDPGRACAPRLLTRPHAGKGAAVAAGLATVNAPLAAFCDIDLSTPLDQLDLVVETAARAGGLAIASRDLAGSRLEQPEEPVREFLGKAYNRLLQATVTPGVVDTQCGAKAAPTDLWRWLLTHCREVGFAWDAEVVAVALSAGVPVHEVPVAWRHDERSKVRLGRDGARMVRAVPRIMLSARRAGGALPRPPAVTVEASVPEVFDDANAATLAAADREHWWFRSKAALVSTAIRRVPTERSGWLVDVGGGAGGVTALLGWRTDRTVVVEGSGVLCRLARSRHNLAAVQGGVAAVPVATGHAEVVCLLDVIEHLANPVAALAEAARIARPGGWVVVNVPAHPRLWSAADDELGHFRRYTRSALRADLVAAGLEPVSVGHVFSWLVPPVWWKRRLRSTGEAELGLDVASPAIDRTAMALTWIERSLVGRLSLPFGTSILAVARGGGSGAQPHGVD